MWAKDRYFGKMPIEQMKCDNYDIYRVIEYDASDRRCIMGGVMILHWGNIEKKEEPRGLPHHLTPWSDPLVWRLSWWGFQCFFAISVIGLFVTLFDFLFHLGCIKYDVSEWKLCWQWLLWPLHKWPDHPMAQVDISDILAKDSSACLKYSLSLFEQWCRCC